MVQGNGNHSTDEVARAAALLIEASAGSHDDAIARAERQVDMSQVKSFAIAVLEEVKRACTGPGRKR